MGLTPRSTGKIHLPNSVTEALDLVQITPVCVVVYDGRRERCMVFACRWSGHIRREQAESIRKQGNEVVQETKEVFGQDETHGLARVCE